MIDLSLDVRLDGVPEPIGILIRETDGGIAFRYQAAYLYQPNALPLSMSLPLAEEPFDDKSTRSFFGNLLQERDIPLQDIMEREGIARDDIVGLATISNVSLFQMAPMPLTTGSQNRRKRVMS